MKRIVAVLAPEPRPALVDLAPRPPAEALRVALERIDPDLLLVRRRAGRQQQLEVVDVAARRPVLARLRRLLDHVHRLARTVVARRRHPLAHRVPELGHRALLADDHPRVAAQRRAPRTRRSPRRPGRRSRRRGRAPCSRRLARARRSARARGARRPRGRRAPPGPRRRTSRICVERPATVNTRSILARDRVSPVPIHVRAEPGDYAEACLLPGDPLRAQYIAETYFDDPVQRNAERGMLGYTGTWEGKPISVQATGMGCPSAAIVMEELVQLGVKRFIRVGTCGGLQPDHAARRHDRRADRRPRRPHGRDVRRPRAALPDRELGARARRRPRGEGDRPADARRPDRLERRLLQPGRAASTSAGRSAACSPSRWRPRCCSRSARCATWTPAALLTVSDVVVEGEFKRITDDELRAAVDRMTRVALATATADSLVHRLPRQPGVRQRRDRTALAADRAHAATLGLKGDALLSERPGTSAISRAKRRDGGASCSSSSAATARSTRSRTASRRDGRRDRADPARHRLGLRP